MSPPLPPSCRRSPAPAHSYDGLLDITHGCTGVTVTNSYLHDHWKASLVGHSDNNGAQDVAITVTFALNRWVDLNSRTPSFRFGHGHIFNNVFDANNDGINTRDGMWRSSSSYLYIRSIYSERPYFT